MLCSTCSRCRRTLRCRTATRRLAFSRFFGPFFRRLTVRWAQRDDLRASIEARLFELEVETKELQAVLDKLDFASPRPRATRAERAERPAKTRRGGRFVSKAKRTRETRIPSERFEAVLAHVRKAGVCTSGGIAAALKLSASSAHRALIVLQERGEVVKTGTTGRSAKWHAAEGGKRAARR